MFSFFLFSLSLFRPPPSFFSQPFSLLSLSISASLTIRQAARLSSGANAARLRRCHSKQLASAIICPISLRSDSPPPLASSSPHPLAKQLASPPAPTPLDSADAARQATCFTSTDVAEICPISLRSDSPYLFGLFMVDFGDWIWFEKLDWRITMIWDWIV